RVEPMAGTDREKALDAALAQIERQFGKGAVMRMGDRTKEPIEVIPTGSTAPDVALGVGGLPRGRVVEIYGPEPSGKTTLTLHAVATRRRPAARSPSWTRSTPSTPSTRRSSASTSTT